MEKNAAQTAEFLTDGKFCPGCGEQLQPADLEMFPRCPYCDHKCADGPQLEDFILEPVLKRWMIHSCQQFMR